MLTSTSMESNPVHYLAVTVEPKVNKYLFFLFSNFCYCSKSVMVGGTSAVQFLRIDTSVSDFVTFSHKVGYIRYKTPNTLAKSAS